MNQSDIRKVIFIMTLPFLGLAIGHIFGEKIVVEIVLILLVGITSSIIVIRNFEGEGK